VEAPTPFYVDKLGPLADPLRLAHLNIPYGEPLVVAGWALDARQRRPAAAVDLVLDGVSYRASVARPRADVASAHGDHAYFRSGFNASLPREVLTPGRHELEIRIVVSGGREYYSATRFRFEAA
jgi:hypothetical protein